jgi:hypothetical protein
MNPEAGIGLRFPRRRQGERGDLRKKNERGATI